MSMSKEQNDNIAKIIVKKYMNALRKQPLITKSCTSGIIAGIGNVIGQKTTAGQINWRGVLSYAATGMLYVGPTMHYFYGILEKFVPPGQRFATIKRIILDRFIVAPPWLFLYFYILSRLEGFSHKGAIDKIKQTFWEILKNNWRVWTIFQYINVNYVPQQFRVLFASCLAFFWNIYVAYARR